MDIKVLQQCLRFFEKLEIEVRDITLAEQRENKQKVVEVDYRYLNKVFVTKPLYYRDVSACGNIRNPEATIKRYGGDVFVLDLDKHGWPRQSGESDLDHLVIDDMVKDGDSEFRKLLLSLGNNFQNGFIQKMTKDGQPGQYYHNLMNNNHWHDLVLLIKATILNKGKPVDSKFLKPLIFKWIAEQRVPIGMRANGWSYKIITDLYNNIQSIQMDAKQEKIVELLDYKKQVILQGPPGTGKTKLAKELASGIIGKIYERKMPYTLDDESIIDTLDGVSQISSVAGGADYNVKLVSVDGFVTLEKSSGKTDNTTFAKIKEAFERRNFTDKITDNPNRRAIALAKYIYDQLEAEEIELDALGSDQFELIQFHPSYTYEDFVRGIVSNPSEDGKGILYEAKNKILAQFAKRAFDNWYYSANPQAFIVSNWLKDTLDRFLINLGTSLDEEDGRLMLTKKAYITKIAHDTIRYDADAWDVDGGVPIIDLIRMYEGGVKSRNDVIKLETLTKTAKHLPTYWFKIYELLLKFISDGDLSPENVVKSKQIKKYVLVIDEINRANLSAVLGELIYALEYRGESVNSMYEFEGDAAIVLPPNLYIIGTMNTADRSVGYIDYAIRRRFAFVDVLAEDLVGLKEDFHSELFHKVSTLFSDIYLAPEFKAKDVQLGHSYFIKQYEKDAKGEKTGKVYPFELRIEYEILPLLREYVNDGVLNEKATALINKISLDYLGKY